MADNQSQQQPQQQQAAQPSQQQPQQRPQLPQQQPQQQQQHQQQQNVQQQQQPQQLQQQQQPQQQQLAQQIQHQQVQQLTQTAQQQAHQPHLMPNLQSQTMTSVPLSMTMAANPNTVNPGTIRNQLGQLPQVHVIHQPMHSPSYLPQYTYNQQQLMLQNMQAAMQANAMGLNPQLNVANMVAMQGRANTMFSQGTFTPSPTTPVATVNASTVATTQMTTTVTGSTNNAKPVMSNSNKPDGTIQQQQQQQQPQQQPQQQIQAQFGQVQQAQATALVGGKPIMLAQANQILPGGIGVLTGQLPSSQNYNTGQFAQLQSKPGQQLGVAGNTAGAQPQLITTQAQIRFSQPQLVASNSQLISSQPVINSQMLQAMTAFQQQYPGQQMISAPGQSPTIIAGQGLYIRQANPVQAQGLMAGVQATITPTLRGAAQPTMQVKQNAALPIQKQTTAAQTGKVLLPSNNKVAMAKVPPTSSSAVSKTTTAAQVKPKARPKPTAKSTTPPTSTSVSLPNQVKPDTPVPGSPKPETPTSQTSLSINSTQPKSQSDSELELAKKAVEDSITTTDVSEKKDKIISEPEKTEEPPAVVEETERPKIVPIKDLTSEPPVEKQRAIVKPHILTHVIEGFVIQEGPEPFPVQRSSLLTEFIPPKPGQPVEQSSLISMDEEDIENQEDRDLGVGMLRCECCGKSDMASNFGSTGRFCSTSCAKRYNVGCSKRLAYFPARPKQKVPRVLKRKKQMKGRKGWKNRSQSLSALPQGDIDMEDQSSSLSQEESPSPSTTPDHTLHTPPPVLHMETDHPPSMTRSPSKWNVNDVYEFIKALPGCSPYADEFRSQEIDGQALLLLKEDHLMTAMNMKLGPALKLCAKINSFKEEAG